MQLWAKPQPGGAVALLVLNNLPLGSENISSTVSLTELNYTHPGPVNPAAGCSMNVQISTCRRVFVECTNTSLSQGVVSLNVQIRPCRRVFVECTNK